MNTEATETIRTTTIRGGVEVLAKVYEDMIMAVTYGNRTQAQKKVARLGEGWNVYQSPLSRVFFVRKITPEAK